MPKKPRQMKGVKRVPSWPGGGAPASRGAIKGIIETSPTRLCGLTSCTCVHLAASAFLLSDTEKEKKYKYKSSCCDCGRRKKAPFTIGNGAFHRQQGRQWLVLRQWQQQQRQLLLHRQLEEQPDVARRKSLAGETQGVTWGWRLELLFPAKGGFEQDINRRDLGLIGLIFGRLLRSIRVLLVHFFPPAVQADVVSFV